MQTAIIDESLCIGCSLCIPVCPVDAIVGARKYMHTVLLDECIGCKLCVPACPVDCITMEPLADRLNAIALEAEGRNPAPAEIVLDKQSRAETAKRRYQARKLRLAKQQQVCLPVFSSTAERSTVLKADIKAALLRVQNKERMPVTIEL